MGKNGAGKSTLLKIIAGQSNPLLENVSAQRCSCCLFAAAFIDYRSYGVEETSKAFGDFGMKAEIDEINEQLTIRTDYESDAYMKLIERVSI
jgi:ATP-binding cassette subfamily F protein 3